MMKENDLLLSIITINYNNKHGLETTIKSVVEQTFKNYEYIVIDGNSNDGSDSLYSNFSENITVFISEPDNGIYDAMNKGLSYANGKWILFLNSGDYLYSNTILEDIFKHNAFHKKDIIYGGVILDKGDNVFEKVKPSELCSLFYKMPFCHQSSFVKRDLIKSRGFNLKYKIASDYDFFCQMYKENKKFKKINLFVSVFETGGVSANNQELMYAEFEKISNSVFNWLLKKKMYFCYRMHALKRKLFMIFG